MMCVHAYGAVTLDAPFPPSDETWVLTDDDDDGGMDQVVDTTAPMFPRPTWFAGAKLNFAENLLFPLVSEPPSGDAVAIIAATEEGRDRKTWKELRERVRIYAAAMVGKVQPGDRVVGTGFFFLLHSDLGERGLTAVRVGFVGNHFEALVAMLAATSLGAIWSGVRCEHHPPRIASYVLPC
jgi:acetoacetyl-CoA synthetase